MPMKRLDFPLATNLNAFSFSVPAVPHRNFVLLAVLSGGGPLTLSTQIS